MLNARAGPHAPLDASPRRSAERTKPAMVVQGAPGMNGEEGRFWMLFLANPRRLRAASTRGVIFPDRSPPERFSFVAPSERSRPTRVGAVVSLHQASAFRASTRARTSALELVRRDTTMPFDLVVRPAIFVPSPRPPRDKNRPTSANGDLFRVRIARGAPRSGSIRAPGPASMASTRRDVAEG